MDPIASSNLDTVLTSSSNKMSWADMSDEAELTDKLNRLRLIPHVTLDEIKAESKIVLCDSNDEIDLYCYTECNRTSPSLVKLCRGIVYDKSGNLVSHTYTYTPEYTSTADHDEITRILTDLGFENCRFFKSYEGALLRLFNYNGHWYLTTHRKLSSFESKWSSRTSFGDLFLQGLGLKRDNVNEFYSKLDVNRQYMFLVTNTNENRIVCIGGDPIVYFVGVFDNENGIVDVNAQTYNQLHDANQNIKLPDSLSFSNLDELFEYVEGKVDPCETQGVIVFLPNNSQMKIFNSIYYELFKLRGNEASVKFRYLQVRNNADMNKRYRQLYSGHKSFFDLYEKQLTGVCQYILDNYKSRYINKEFVTLPKEEYTIMCNIHKQYLDRVQTNRRYRIDLKEVTTFVNSVNPSILNKIIKRRNENGL